MQALYQRDAARGRIEKVFADAVSEVLAPFTLADLRVVVLNGESDHPPALAIVCESVGQLDLGWIEKSNVLSTTLFETIAPVRWRAAAYQALEGTLNAALPVFNYAGLMEELSAYYWDGETEDEGARAALTDLHGGEPDEDIDLVLPSHVAAKRPDWMTAKAAPLKHMPGRLRAALSRLRTAHAAVRAITPAGSAWCYDRETIETYLPEYMDRAPLQPVTLVPFDHFARELDDVGRFGMEQGFDDIAGLCPIADPATVDTWFASLRIGAELLLAAQALIELDPLEAVRP